MFIADACAVVAYLGDGGAGMSAAGRAAMNAATISPITVWELTRKAALGKLPPLPLERGSFARHLAALGFRDEPLLHSDAEEANRLPLIHKDPMDRMLIATALRTGKAVITNDGLFERYGTATVW